MCPLAPRPPGAGRVGRAYGASWSALTARGLCGSPRPVFAGCHMSRGTPAPGSPGRPLQACGRVRRVRRRARLRGPQLQASGLHPSPDSRHGSCGDNFRAGPDAPRRTRRANGVDTPGCLRFAMRLRSGELRRHKAVAASPRSCRTLRFPSPEEVGAWKTKLCGCRLEIGRSGCPTTGDPAAAKVMAWGKSADFQSSETGHGPASNAWNLVSRGRRRAGP